ncbi:RHS repeat-associated core domain-containing protein [Pseudomonas azotoformans]
MNVYSGAFSFGSYLAGSVDERTGQYLSKVKLATLYPSGPLEVSKHVTLSFSMLNTQPSRYGIGWRISNTEFDVDTLTLTLLTGERYKTQSLPSVGGTLAFTDRKLKDLVVKRPTADTLHVIYKDGTVEVLKKHGSTVPYRINAIQFENGESLSFRYALGEHLDRILNQKGEELVVLTYSQSWILSTVDTLVDGGHYARVRFSYTNGYLTGVTVPYDLSGPPGSAAYTFAYTVFRNGLSAIESVKRPMGGEERITYSENTLAYGNNQYIPSVDTWVQIPGANQPRMTRKYSYSPGSNFSGPPYSGGFQEGEDNLLKVAGPYVYWTEETRIDAADNNKVLMVTRTNYNKFHLQTEKTVRRDGTLSKTSVIYNMVAGQFSVQPANYAIPKTVTQRYERTGNPAREVYEHIETDDFGNELSHTEASGVRTEYSYYPIAGEAGKCPADSHNLFPRYVKQERLFPEGATVAARVTDYTHTRLPATGARYFVLQQSIVQTGSFSQQHTYYDAPAELAGRLKTSSCTIGGLTLVSNFSYIIAGDRLIETRRLQGREGQWVESQRTLSLVNRLEVSMTRDGGCTLALAFDVNGRLVEEVVSPGKSQQAKRDYAYHFSTPSKAAHLITTDAQGNQVVTSFDGLGRQVSENQLMAGPRERAVGTRTYDALGQLIEQVDFDYVTDGQRVLKTVYSYNSWGNSSSVTGADGRVLIDEYDPQLNLKVEGVVGGQRLRTYFNEHSQPVKVERLDASNNSVEVESRTYDGLGRCLLVKDVNDTSTEFTYDTFDRLLTVLQKPVDGTPQRLRKIDYAPGTSSETVSSLSIDGKQLGTRSYDSLGRMTSQTRGTGQASTWEYEPGWMAPVAMVSPRGARQSLTYDKELDVQTKVEMTGLPVSTYKHDDVAGTLTRSETNGLIHEYVHDVNGHLEKETQNSNGTPLTALYSYSPGGRLLRQTAVDGQVSQLEYDALGRFSKIVTGSMVVEQSYDTLGRPQNLTTAYGSTEVLTKLSYDGLGRESSRRFEQNGALLQVITSTYDANSMLATRVLTDASSQVVTDEKFTYDAFLRLLTYRCQGREQPKDQLGRGVVGQVFSFDSLNNITQVITSFTDGTQDTCVRFFTSTDPTRLTRLTHTLPVQDVTLTYDAAGNLQVGASGHTYTYNSFDQLTGVRANSLQYSYEYDAESRQVLASRGNEPPVNLMYMEDRLDTLIEGSKKIRFADGGDQVLARSGGVDGPQLHTNDASGSVRGISAPGLAHVRRHYTPYGEAQVVPNDGKTRTMADLQLPAFNGHRLDASCNLYVLGNGQRVYDPGLLVFLQPDPLSPFDEGGINSYEYCACNPSNLMDPSGLWPSWLKWVLTGTALALSIVTVGFATPGLMAAAAAYTAAATAAGLAAASGGVAAAAATGAAATAAMVVASKSAVFIASALGVVGGTLSTAALGIAEVDRMTGWDRSHHIRNLGWASLGVSIASWTASIGGAYTSASLAYNAAAKAGTAKDFVKYTGFFDTPLGSGLQAAGKRMVGLTYKFTDKQGITTFSKVYGVTRFALRTTNFGRAIEARSKAASPASESGPTEPGSTASAQPQAAGSLLFDMPTSSAGYFQAFRDEASRIRQPSWWN